MGVRKSVNFNVSLEAYEKVKEIFPDVIGTEDNLLQLVTAYKFWCEHKDDINTDNSGVIAELEAKITKLESDNRNLTEEYNTLSAANEQNKSGIQAIIDAKQAAEQERDGLQERINALIAEAGALPEWSAIKQTIEPFPVKLLEATAERLSEYYGREVSPMQVMVDMFLRYTIERNAEWFYPFMLKDKDIVSYAHEINPDVISIGQIKKSLKLD